MVIVSSWIPEDTLPNFIQTSRLSLIAQSSGMFNPLRLKESQKVILQENLISGQSRAPDEFLRFKSGNCVEPPSKRCYNSSLSKLLFQRTVIIRTDRSMENNTIDRILENLFHILPMIHKKLLRMDLDGVTGDLSRLHLAIMGMLREKSLAVSEVAKILVIPKSQMTHLIDQLVDLDIVARHPDAKDRRVINISLTDHGKAMLKECRRIMKQTMRNKLSHLTPAELADLSIALEKLKNIGAKLE